MTNIEIGTDCQSQLAYAQTRVETLEMHKETLRRESDALRAKLAAAERERDEARAEIDGYIDTIAQLSVRCDTVAFHAQTVETALIAAAAERDEARAEIERLRLPADAWETQRRFMFLAAEDDSANHGEFDSDDALIAAWEAEARARGISPSEIDGYDECKDAARARVAKGDK
jgi:chromosome segregation ATPase